MNKKRIILLLLVMVVLLYPGCSDDDGGPYSNNAFLSSLAPDAGTLTPAFSSNVYQYALNVTNAVASLGLAAVAADATAQVSVSPSAPMALSVGSNMATITVTAEDGTNVREYRVIIRRNGETPGDLVSPVAGITLKGVPAGAFQRDGTAANTSFVSAFRVMATEVTRAQFLTVMGHDPSDLSVSSSTNDPVQNVNRYHIMAFCNKLSLRDGLDEVYAVAGVDFSTLVFADIPITNNADWNSPTVTWTAGGYRLPTEMEWQWAAMGAMDAPGKAFAGSDGSNSIDDYVWYGDSSGPTHPVAGKLPNELGLYDMSGNVSEWCWDWYDSYPAGFLADYRGPVPLWEIIIRGGNKKNGAAFQTVAYRSFREPNLPDKLFGFRVVRP